MVERVVGVRTELIIYRVTMQQCLPMGRQGPGRLLPWRERLMMSC
jgi:hypothetical protein